MTDEEKKPFNEAYEAEMVIWNEAHPKPEKPEKKKSKKESTDGEGSDKKEEDKRPLSGYMKWMNDVFRPQWKEKMEPGEKMNIGEVGKAAGVAWAAMDPEDKDPLDAAYKQAMTEWRVRNNVPEPVEKEAKAPKPPKSAMHMYINDEFRSQYKEENAEAKAPEVNAAGNTSWESLSEEDKASWDSKYAARLTELGVDREEHETHQREASEKAAKKPPKDSFQMFVSEEFTAKFKEEKPDTKVEGWKKELNAGAKEAWEALTDEVRGEWEAKWKALCETMGVDPNQESAKPKKPKKESAKKWQDIYLAEQVEKIKAKKPDQSEEDLLKEATIKLKNMSKSEKMAFQDKAKTIKVKSDKVFEEATKEYERLLEEYENSVSEKNDAKA